MDRHWIEAAQREGRQVGVIWGAVAAEVNPTTTAPVVVPARVKGPDPEEGPDTWWLEVEFLPGGEPMSLMYREVEILGFWPRHD